MEFLCALKVWKDKITLFQSKKFKNDAKKLKLTHTLDNLKNFPKYLEIFVANEIFFMMSALFRQKSQKINKFLLDFKVFFKMIQILYVSD